MYESAFDEFHETGEVGPQYLALVGRSLRAVIPEGGSHRRRAMRAGPLARLTMRFMTSW